MDSDSLLPAPLVSAEVDLTDFAFMPLDVRRLRDSDLAALETPEACWAAVLLWSASWHQVPAASLPDDDRVLAQLAGFGRVVKEWMRVRSGALRGWVTCSDGRLYHPVVAEKAREAWASRLSHRWRSECSRIRKHAQRHKIELHVPDYEEWLSNGCPMGQPLPVPKDTPELSQGTTGGSPSPVFEENRGQGQGDGERQGEGEGEGQGESIKEGVNPSSQPESTADIPSGKPADKKASSPDETELQAACRRTWAAYSEAYANRHGAAPVRNKTVNSLIKQFVQRIAYAEAPGVAAFYVQHNDRKYVAAKHPVNLMLANAETLRTDWVTGRQTTQAEATHADRAQSLHSAAEQAMQNLAAEGFA